MDLAGLVFASGKSGGFIAGADIKEFDGFDDAERLSDSLRQVHGMFDRIESLPYTTVALIDGFCLGGGLELALCFDARVATERAKLGFPEVKLGIFPGFGGTGRSVALSGGVQAMPAMLTGKNYNARAARRIGWVDQVVSTPDRMRWRAIKMIQRGAPKRKLSLIQRAEKITPIRRFIVNKMRQQTQAKANPEHYPAPFALIDLYEEHGGNPKAMRQAEIDRFPPLMLSTAAASLRRVFFLSEEMKAGAAKLDPMTRVHVIGAGVMGGDIAAWCAFSGYQVTLQDMTSDAVEGALKRAHKMFAKRLKKQPAINNAKARLIADPQGQGIAQADVIIEAVVERLDVKQRLFADLEAQAKSTAVLATNTSSIELEQIAEGMGDPSQLVGIHFFNPVAQLPLVEIVQSKHTDQAMVQKARSLVVAIRKFPLVVKSSPGFLVNRVLGPYMFGALKRLDEGGNTPELAAELDAAAVRFGMPMGPIELVDTVGLDVCAAVAKTLGLSDGEGSHLAKLIDQGHLGRKTGKGFYTWTDGKLSRSLPPGDLALGRELIGPLVDTAQACVDEGIVESADLADAGVIMGTGFAPFLGGPLNARRLEQA